MLMSQNKKKKGRTQLRGQRITQTVYSAHMLALSCEGEMYFIFSKGSGYKHLVPKNVFKRQM